MCWACDKDAAKALLRDSELVFAEAETLRKQASQMEAQAHGDMNRALTKYGEDNTICKEIEDACEST